MLLYLKGMVASNTCLSTVVYLTFIYFSSIDDMIWLYNLPANHTRVVLQYNVYIR